MAIKSTADSFKSHPPLVLCHQLVKQIQQLFL